MKTVKLVILGALAVAAILLFSNISLFSVGGASEPGSKVPHFTLNDNFGNSYCTHDFENKVTILTFWFPTCPACLQELPRLEKIWRDYKDKGLNVVALEATGQKAAADKFINQNGLTFKFLQNGIGGEEVASNLFKVEMFPTTLIIDKTGIVRFKHVGFRPGDEQKLLSEVKSLLDE